MAMNIRERLERAFGLFDGGKFDEAEAIYEECLGSLTEKSSPYYVEALHGLGYVRSAKGRYAEARDCYRELLEMAKEQDDWQKEAVVLHQSGMVERMAGCLPEAKDFFEKEYVIWKHEAPDFHVGFSANFYEQGIVALKEGNEREAGTFLQQALEFAERSGDLVALGCAHRGLGELMASLDKKEEADMQFHSAVRAFEEAGDVQAVKDVNRLHRGLD